MPAPVGTPVDIAFGTAFAALAAAGLATMARGWSAAPTPPRGSTRNGGLPGQRGGGVQPPAGGGGDKGGGEGGEEGGEGGGGVARAPELPRLQRSLDRGWRRLLRPCRRRVLLVVGGGPGSAGSAWCLLYFFVVWGTTC